MPAPLQILAVDDDPRSLSTLRRALSNVSADVVEATRATDALALLASRQFALAILDVQLEGGMSGYELAEEIRRIPDGRGLPIVFVSGSHAEEQHVFRGYETGAVDYLLKPFDPRVLSSKVNVFLELARQRRELEEYGFRLERMVRERTRSVEEKAQEVDSIMEGAPVALIVTNVSGRVLRMNQAAESLLGHRREDMLGGPIDVLAPPDARPTHEVFGPALSHFPLGTRRVEIRSARGETFPARCSVNVVEGPGGSRRIIAIEDARPTVELERARSELHALLEATDSLVLHASLGGALHHVNDAGRALLDRHGDDLEGRNLFGLLDASTADALRVAIDGLRDDERVWRGRGRLGGGEGPERDLLAVLRPRHRGAPGTVTLVARPV